MHAAVIGSLIASGVIGAKAQSNAGKAAKIQYQQQARGEETAAKDREIARRRRLVSALASQNAEAGALGITPGVGSRKAIALADAKRASFEGLSDRASTGRRAVMLRSAGKAAQREGNLAAASTLLGTATDTLNAWVPKDKR